MGALLQRVGLQKSPSQSLVQAPSADLIKPDTAPELPEMVEIKCKLSPEQLESYIRQIDNTECHNLGLKMEYLRHLLIRLGYQQYTKNDIKNFCDKRKKYLQKKEGRNYLFLQMEWLYVDTLSFIPPRIIHKINRIRINFTHHLEFTILGYKKDYGNTWHDIFFLGVSIKAKKRNNIESFIIDAWRGPTFSDEDSYLPGQEKK